MALAERARMTAAEYLDWEARQPERRVVCQFEI